MARPIALGISLLAVMLCALPDPGLAQQPRRGGVLRIAEREAPGLDPHLTVSFLSHSYISLAYSQLVRFPNGPEQKHPADFSILPDLAEKWEYKTPTSLVFTLRKGVKFHNKPPVNGREVTAEDVKYSLDRFMAKSGFRARFDAVQAIEAVDRYTVRIALKEPFAPFLNHLANPTFTAILPREAEEKFKDFNHPDAVIGTGPFILRSYDKGVKVVFERNPDYYMKGLPYLDGVVIEIAPDTQTRLSLLRAGKVEMAHIWGWLSPEEGRAVKQTNPEMVVTPYKVIGVGHIYMRTDQPPFNDVRVRRAVSLAIDRKAWNDALLFGEGCIDSGPIPCAMTDWKLDAAKMDPAKTKTLVGYDPAEAKRLLAQAGHPKGFTTPMFNWPGYVSPWRSYYELAAEALGKVGITVELKPEEYGKYISTTYLGKFEKMAMGPSTPFTEVDDFLYGTHFPEQPNNRSSVADAELNKLLIAQRRELDPKKRKEIVDEIQRYLADKQYYVYVPQWPQYVSHPPYVKGFKHHDGYGLGLRLLYTWLDK
ncbi:MAG: ABC transporter substrate-binding protein [Candidatus Rokubacteria bacterium]|nr:ABC transporter substrate-binding protein [Candidatus Rokubacteria bacterium]